MDFSTKIIYNEGISMKFSKKFVFLILLVILIIIIILPNIKILPDKNEVSFRSVTEVNSKDQKIYCPPLSLDTEGYKIFTSNSGYSLQYHPYLKSVQIKNPEWYELNYKSIAELILEAPLPSTSLTVSISKMPEKLVDKLYKHHLLRKDPFCTINNDSKIFHYDVNSLGTDIYYVDAYIRSPNFAQDGLIIGIKCSQFRKQSCKKLVPQIITTLKFY